MKNAKMHLETLGAILKESSSGFPEEVEEGLFKLENCFSLSNGTEILKSEIYVRIF